MSSKAKVLISFLFILGINSHFLISGKIDSRYGSDKIVQNSESQISDNESSDSLKRKSELNRIVSLLPADVTFRGHVSFLDKTFNDWLSRTGELPPNFDEMPSIPFLPDPLILDEGSENIPVTNLNQWDAKKEWMKKELQRYITGTFPPAPDNLEYKIINETKDGDVTIQIVELSFGPEHKAKLTLELMIPPGDGPFPVFLTNWNHRIWAYVAVRRGYIGCLYAGADIKDDTEAYSEIWAYQYDFTRLMRRAYGASRAIDYLYTLPFVDKDKIGITGHSRNGKTSLMAAAFDERIGACIPSSGGTGAEVPWRYNAHKYDVEDIALLSCQQPAWLHPRLRFFIGREHKLPIDQNSFMALVAPRGLMLSTASTEGGSNIFGIETALHSARSVFKFLNAENNIAIATRYGVHGVNAADIEGYVDFFDYVFKRSDRKPESRQHYNYSFEEWQKLTGEVIDPLTFEKINNPVSLNEKKRGINLSSWNAKRTDILRKIQWLLGNEPAGVTNPGPGTLAKGGIGEKKRGSFLIRPETTDSMKVMAITPYDGFGDNLFGYLYYPANKEGEMKNKNLPIVIYLHEYDYSKGFSYLGYDHDMQPVFEKLTKMGFGVFSYDMIGFGNRLKEGYHFYDRYPGWSKMGRMVADVKSAVDAISNLDFVDSNHIYTLGYSLGATVALFSAAQDNRIAGVVSVAGFTPMRTNTLDRGTEGIKSFSHLHGLIPRLGFFVNNEDRIPVDFNEIISSIAPRPVLVIAPEYDKDAHNEDIEKCVEDSRNIYGLYAKTKEIQLYTPGDYNRFSDVMRDKTYEWLRNQTEK